MSVYEAVHVSHTKSNIYKIRYEKKTFCQHNRQPPYSIASNNHWSIVNIFPVDLYSQLSIVDFFYIQLAWPPEEYALHCDCAQFHPSWMPFPPMEKVTQWTAAGIFSPVLKEGWWWRGLWVYLCMCAVWKWGCNIPRGGQHKSKGTKTHPYLAGGFCLPWQLSVPRGARNNELD